MSGYHKIGGYRARQILEMTKGGPVPLGRIMAKTRMPKHTMWNALCRLVDDGYVTVDKGVVTPCQQIGSRWHQWDMSRPITNAI